MRKNKLESSDIEAPSAAVKQENQSHACLLSDLFMDRVGYWRVDLSQISVTFHVSNFSSSRGWVDSFDVVEGWEAGQE